MKRPQATSFQREPSSPFLSRPSTTPGASCLGLLAGTFWVAQIGQPGPAVELGVRRLDLALLVDVEDVDALDLLVVVAGAADGDPAPADLVAAVEGVERLEVERRLCAG